MLAATVPVVITASFLLAGLGWVMSRDSKDEYGAALVDQSA